MKLLETVLTALRGLTANKMRSVLTMLGVIIGVGAVIAMIALGQGAEHMVSEQFAGLGPDLLIVSGNRLTKVHSEAILEDTASVKNAAPELSERLLLRFERESTRESVVGVTPRHLQVQNLDLAWGRFIAESDLERRARVAVLGSEVADELFSGRDPVGEMLRIGNYSFEIVGLLAEKGRGIFNTDSNVYIPLTTAQDRVFNSRSLSTIYAQSLDSDRVRITEGELFTLLSRMFGNADDFNIRNFGQIMEAREAAMQTFTLLLAGIAGVSLLVGGIGIMNIMLVSVTERTREVGIRKALGACRHNILVQFLIEAMVLSGIGGLFGIGLGMGISEAFSRIVGWPAVFPLPIAVGALVFSLAVGLFFGSWPAYKAASLDPIDALRYE